MSPPAVTPDAAASASPDERVVLLIDGVQASGGSLQLDLGALCGPGLRSISVATDVAPEERQGASFPIEAPSPRRVSAQIAAALAQQPIHAIKVGLTVTRQVMRGIGQQLRRLPRTLPIVVDPSLRTYRRQWLIEPGHDAALRDHLLPLATLITPNLPEACLLSDLDLIEEIDDMEEAARRIAAAFPRAAVLVTGGNLHGRALDVLCHDGEIVRIDGPWIGRENAPGAGSVLATLLAAGLARGQELRAAVGEAKRLLTGLLESAPRAADGTPQLCGDRSAGLVTTRA